LIDDTGVPKLRNTNTHTLLMPELYTRDVACNLNVHISIIHLSDCRIFMYSMRQNVQYWNKKTNNISLFPSVSLFLLKETNIHSIRVFINHGMRNVNLHRLAVDSVYIISTYASFSIVYFGAYCIISVNIYTNSPFEPSCKKWKKKY
jgi:hypothetical protein